MFNEPHYNLPLLSVMPRRMSHIYLRLFGKGDYYYEKHLTYWGLRKMTEKFELADFTGKIIFDPDRYSASYMIKPGSLKQKLAKFMTRYLIWIVPAYIWVLEKPKNKP